MSVKQSVTKAFWLAAGALACLPAFANPQGATVVHGSARFARPDAGTLEVTNSNNAIINWQSFSIDQGEITRFVQPSANSAVLNRVTGADASAIYGQLNSNGRVFLINQNGILVGESGAINTAGFVGSTLDIGNGDFLNDELNFAGERAGSILNNGFITAGPGGEIVLVAPEIENRGAITAENGKILLAAGEKVTLGSAGLDGIRFEVQAPDNRVLNLGELIAERGSVGVFAGSIRHEGVIEANSMGTDAAGNIVLKAQSDIENGDDSLIQANGDQGGRIAVQSKSGTSWVSGGIEAVGRQGEGGRIHVLGERVGLIDAATLNASGRHGGGEVLVGGDYRGENPDIQNATGTYIGNGTSINADALVNGSGGRVIAWGTDAARVYGAISARGAGSGDGGFVETSGHYLDVKGSPDVSAENGNGGTWLLDPYDITVDVGTGDIPSVGSGPPPEELFQASLDSSFLSVADLIFALESQTGVNVIIDTNSGSGTQPGNVLFNAPVAVTPVGNATLSVRADGDITFGINGGIAATGGSLNLDLQSNRNGADNIGGIFVDNPINTNGGNIIFNSDGQLQSTGFGIQIGAGATIDAGSGDIDLLAQTERIALQGSAGQLNSTGTVLFEANQLTFLGSALSGAPDVIIRAVGGGSIDLGARVNGDLLIGGNVMTGISGASSLTVGGAAAGSISVENVFSGSFTNGLTLRTGGDILFNQGNQDGITADAGSVVLEAAGRIAGSGATGGEDLVGGAGSTLDVTAGSGVNFSTDFEQLRFNNTGDGVVDIVGRGTLLQIAGGNNASTNQLTKVSTADGTIQVNGAVQGSGGGIELIAAGTTGAIENNSAIADTGGILLEADSMQLQPGSSIDSGINADTVLRRSTAGTWTLGGTDADLGSAELDTIQNSVVVGDANGTVTTATIVQPIALGGGQDFAINATNLIDFAQFGGTGITTTGAVRLNSNAVVHNAGIETDVSAASLTVDAPGGVGISGTPLLTQVDTFEVTSGNGIFIANTGNAQIRQLDTTAGQIDFNNIGGNVTILPTGIRNTSAEGADGVSVDVSEGDLLLDGALIATNGGSIELLSEGGIQLIGDDQANRAATVTAANGAADITLNTGNGILLQGGSVDNNRTELRGANVNFTAGSGNIRLLGGAGVNTETRIEALTSFSALAGGNMVLQGGAGDFSQASIQSPNISITATGDLSLLGGGATEAAARLEGASLDLNADNLTLRGGTGAYTTAGIDAVDMVQVQVGNDLTLQGGSGRAAIAVIGDAGEGVPVTMRFEIGRNLSLAGGSGSDALAAIGSKDGPVDIEIGVNSDFQPVPVGGNITLTAGSGAVGTDENLGAIAGIGTFGAGNDANITIRGNRSLTMTSNAAAGNGTFIGANDAAGAVAIDVGQGATGGNLNINGGRIVSQGSVSLRARSGSAANGDIVLDGGLLDAAGLTAAADGRFYLRGGVVNVINADIVGRYTQSGGTTVLRDSIFNVSGQYDLLGGSLTGSGTIVTPLLNNAGGVIAPGTNLGALSPDGAAGLLTIDGDLAMGAGGTLSVDLMGADNELGRQVGLLYDGLRVNGNTQLGGELELVVNTALYRGAPEDRYRPFDFADMVGRFDSVSSSPVGYIFARRIADDGTFNVIMTGTPFDSGGTFITEDEIQTLNRDLGEQLEEMIRIQRKRAFTGELPDKEDERKKRRAMVCS